LPQSLPIAFFVASDQPRMGLATLKGWLITDWRAVVNKVPCVLVERQSPASHIVESLWLDPKKDYSIIRQQVRDGTLIDIEYKRERELWRPTAWKAVISWSKDHKQTIHATVTKFEFDKKLPPALFGLSFVPGALVSDRMTSKTAIVRPDGTLMPISRND